MDSIQAEEQLYSYLKTLSKFDGVSLGLIIGQVSEVKTYVVHFAPTPEQSKDACLGNLKDFDATGLGDHARYVTRMLLGGLCIVGIFVVSSGEIFNPAGIPVIRKMLKAVDGKLKDEYGGDPQVSGSLVVLHYSGPKNELAVKRFDKDALKNVNWVFKDTASIWVEINTEFNLTRHFFESKRQNCFTDNLKNALRKIVASFDQMVFFLQYEQHDPKSSIESYVDEDNELLIGQLHRLFPKTEPKEITVSNSPEQLILIGRVPSKIFLHPRTTVEEAGRAVKQDILRSLAARLELHGETLVDEANGSPEEHERVHEPPRRVLIRPSGWNIMLADYVFPGEGAKEVIKSCKDLLDINVVTADILDTFELSGDPYTILGASQPESKKQPVSSFARIMVFLCGVVVLLLSIGLHYIFSLN